MVFEQVKIELEKQEMITRVAMFNSLATYLKVRRHLPFIHLVVD